MFPCWDHWPVAQLPNDGRKALISDRPSHFSLLAPGDPSRQWKQRGDVPLRHDRPTSRNPRAALEIIELPPAATIAGQGFEGGAYKKSERAYIFTTKSPGAGPLEFALEASHDSPIHNPAFMVKNWGNRPAVLTIDRKEIPHGKAFRFGHNKTLDRTDLVVWLKIKGDKKTSFKIQAP